MDELAWQQKDDPQEQTLDNSRKLSSADFTENAARLTRRPENAKNRKRIRKFQKVLGIEKDVKPRWYKVADPSDLPRDAVSSLLLIAYVVRAFVWSFCVSRCGHHCRYSAVLISRVSRLIL
ncbi:hypothetical protein BS47DRAFT_1489723 [Hydnum rufescens UP504]|uniref:Uncharacterized protein n=1 Tax=Hydnum rufescens UP504 TaxID=1448309 RepID=A0A9P6AHC2_9AGAM|nr:hypothetical protein BS47DRAFT_1489723 [Hydnum rufescens UP504]